MRNDYLWDGSGEPDPEVERLERLLSEFRSRPSAPPRSANIRVSWGAIAAAIALVATGTWLLSGGMPEGWQVAQDRARSARLLVGETLETGAEDYATLNA